MSQGYADQNLTENTRRAFDSAWTRPSDWLALPTVLASDETIVALHAVFPGSGANFCAFTISAGAYTVDWGYGSPENFSTGATAYHTFNYDDYPSGSICSRGYKQAIVTITPQAGQHFTGTINFHVQHNQSNLAIPYTQGWLEMTASCQSCTSIVFGKTTTSYYCWPFLLEQFTLVGPHASFSNASAMFRNSFKLRKFNCDESFGASLSQATYMFENCRFLIEAPMFNTSAITNATYMFQNCFSLTYVPQYNTQNIQDSSYMFYGDVALENVPLLNLQNVTNTSSMFWGCVNLKSVPNFNLKSVITSSLMFRGCNSLENVPDFNTSGAVTMNEMFYDCNSLTTAPNIDLRSAQNISSMFFSCDNINSFPQFNFSGTVTNATGFASNVKKIKSVPDWNLSGATRLESLFSGCDSLTVAPNINSVSCINTSNMFLNCFSLTEISSGIITSGVGTFTSMFQGCSTLQEIPSSISTQNGITFTSMFNACSVLKKIPLLSVSSGTVFTTMFSNCVNLATGALSGTRYTISYAGCNLSATELNNIYTNLGTAAGAQTITVTGNYGITGDDITIATGKGWTVAT